MKSRLTKLAFTFCSLWMLSLTVTLHAQDTTANAGPSSPGPGRAFFGGREVDTGPIYDVQIENGMLSVTSLKGRPEAKEAWGSGSPVGVTATVGNLAKYLRIVNTNLNLVVSGDAADVKIGDLKIRSDMNSILEALSVVTGGNVRGSGRTERPRGFSDKDAFFISANRAATVSHRTVEVFNLGGYIKTLGTNEDVIRMNLDKVQLLTMQTLESLYPGNNIEKPSFRFHSGTSLVIVTGDSDYIDVARKIINALPGQQKTGREDLMLDVTQPSGQK